MRITRFLPIIILCLLSLPSYAKSTWYPLKSSKQNIEKSIVEKKLKNEVKNQVNSLMKYRYLMRIEILGGGGPNRLSETVFYFKNKAKLCAVNAKSDKSGRSAITFSAFKECPWNSAKKRHYCPGAGISGEGTFDMTDKLKKKTILVLSSAKRRYKAKTIIWLAFDKPSASIYYFQFASKQFGLDNLTSIFYTITPDKAPELPPMLGEKPQLKEKPVVKKTNTKPPVKLSPVKDPVDPTSIPAKTKVLTGFRKLSLYPLRNSIQGLFKNDHISKLYITGKTEQLNWIRIQGNNLDYNEDNAGLKIIFRSRPSKLYIFAWTDERNSKLSSIGDMTTCKKNGYRGCPYHIDGKVWYDFSRYIHSKSVEIRSFPRNIRKGNFILWAGFNNSVGAPKYNQGSFKGKISAYFKGKITAITGRISKTKNRYGVKPVVKNVSVTELSNFLRRDGIIPQNSGLMSYPYVMRMVVVPGRSAYSNIIIKLKQNSSLVLGKAFSKAGARKNKSAVQIGNLSKCQGTGRNLWCPYHINGLGWKALTSIFNRGNNRIVMKSGAGNAKKIILWMAFNNNPQKLIPVRIFPKGKNSPFINSTILNVFDDQI